MKVYAGNKAITGQLLDKLCLGCMAVTTLLARWLCSKRSSKRSRVVFARSAPALRGAGPSLPDISVDVPPLDSSVSGAPTVIPRLADRAPLQLDRDTSSDSDEGADPPGS